MSDLIYHPKHYSNKRFGDVECIDFARYLTYPAGAGFKYVWRHLDKNNAEEDLEKALVFIDWAKHDFHEHGLAAVLPGKEGLIFSMACKYLSGPAANEGAFKALNSILYNSHTQAAWQIADYIVEHL